ncbi:MAG: hypothetical protein V4631_19800 [Pseudomonadota bacterium]
MNLQEHTRCPPNDTGLCAHCGQPLPAAQLSLHVYGAKRVNPAGLAVTVLFHVLLLAVFLLRPEVKKKPPAPPRTDITYIAPVAPKAKPPAPKPVTKPGVRVKRAPSHSAVARLPNTIHLPNEQPPPRLEPVPSPEPVVVKIDPAEDMSAMIEARRRARGQGEQPAEESAAERGNRIARANIASANGKKGGKGSSESVFEVRGLAFSSRELKFNTAFQQTGRSRLRLVTVELGTEPDIETAVVKQMIEMIRDVTKDDLVWTYDKGEPNERRIVLSARKQDTEELAAFLMKEYFPAHRPPRR